MIRYVITDRKTAGGVAALLQQVRRNIAEGVDYVQVREKDLAERDLLALTESIVGLAAGTATRVLVSGRVDIAMAAGAHGVHLPSDAIAAERWRRVVPAGFVIGVSCHAGDELAVPGADYVLYAPVFAPRSKAQTSEPVGIVGLRAACAVARVPVIALGGITWDNTAACREAGAAGIAAITLFQDAGPSSGTMEKHG